MEKLTPSSARDLKPGGILRDHEVTGLELRCQPSGWKSWMLYYRTRDGRERRPRIGGYPEMTLAEARKVAKELKLKVAAGEDPSKAWKASRQAPTMADLCDLYLQEWAKRRMKSNSIRQHEQLIEAQIKPGLGHKRITDITPSDVDGFLEKVYNRHFIQKDDGKHDTAHWTAHHTRALLSKLFKRAKVYFEISLPRDPMADTKAYGRIRRNRHASMQEVPRIAAALNELAESEPARAAFFWTLFLTGARVTEIRSLRGDQIIERQFLPPRTGSYYVISMTDHKTVKHIGTKEHVLPLPAAQIIEKLGAIGKQRCVFPVLSVRRYQDLWNRVRMVAGCEDLKMLDARRTFASFGLSLGLGLDQVGELLGHTDTQTTKGYAYLMAETKQQAAEQTANLFMQAAGPSSIKESKNKRKRSGDGRRADDISDGQNVSFQPHNTVSP